MTEETRFVLVELEKVERKLDHLIDEVRGQKITIELINKSLSRSKNGRVTIGVLVCALLALLWWSLSTPAVHPVFGAPPREAPKSLPTPVPPAPLPQR
jgi:hypothetical protein